VHFHTNIRSLKNEGNDLGYPRILGLKGSKMKVMVMVTVTVRVQQYGVSSHSMSAF